MRFVLLEPRAGPPSEAREIAYLIKDRWDDWAKFRTQFALVIFDSQGRRIEPGPVKIGEQGLLPAPESEIAPGKRAPAVPPTFESLSEKFFSLGQSDTYYEALLLLPREIRETILVALRDCAFDLSIFDAMSNQEVMQESLLRDVPISAVRNRFNRLAHGDAALEEFYFEYQLPSRGSQGLPPKIDFHVQPLSEPPTNVHVLIGRNGVGKTRCMQSMARALLRAEPNPVESGIINIPRLLTREWSFAGLVAVSFSAFDRFSLPQITRSGIRAAMIGHVEETAVDDAANIQEPALSHADIFRSSLGKCRNEPRRSRLQLAIATLENDPLFAEAGVSTLLDASDETWNEQATRLFGRLSSGHAIVLLTITRLVQLVDERTIVLLDEPESHLHPPLLSAFIRALSDLLVTRNGVAIIATHSPVVLQEVPKSSVWLLRRSGHVATAERPSIETFGENVGVLTREVFGLEVTNSGFHRLLKDAIADRSRNYDEAVAHFGNQLGAEAQAVLRSLLALRDRESSSNS
jgi:hypothetical protein